MSELRAAVQHITANFLNLRGYECSNQTSGIHETLVRQAKLGTSCKVKVLVGKGLANHPYRVLR